MKMIGDFIVSTLKRIYTCDREDNNKGHNNDYDVLAFVCMSLLSSPPFLSVYGNDWQDCFFAVDSLPQGHRFILCWGVIAS
mmetsp:Transcript_8929/g.14735  ORF Transcript_8929/g.14735 Transcript_8929/m.14735 type:complete len:81 (-) Transcript_8929:12-254(-)